MVCRKQGAGPPSPAVLAQCLIKMAIAAPLGIQALCTKGEKGTPESREGGRKRSDLASYPLGLSFDPWIIMWCDWWSMELRNQPAFSFIWTQDTYPEDWRGGVTSFPSPIQVAPHHPLPACISQTQTFSSDKKLLHHKFLKAQFLHWEQDCAFLGMPENAMQCIDRLKNSNKSPSQKY